VNRTVALNAIAIIVILLATSAVWSSEQPSSTQRIPQFENLHVKVWRSTVVPNAPLPLHRHDHGRVIIALQGGTMKIEDQSGTSETHVWEEKLIGCRRILPLPCTETLMWAIAPSK